MTQAQQWLDSKYNNKQSGDNIKLLTSEELSGEIIIETYPSTKEINLVRLENGSLSKGKITKVTIRNCPAVEKIILANNEITTLVFEGNFPNLTQLELQDNQLKEIELSKLPNLEHLNIARNPTNSQVIEEGLKNLTKLKFADLLDTTGFNLKNAVDKAVKQEADKYKDYIDPKDPKNKDKIEAVAKDAGFIDPKDSSALEKAANDQGKTVVSQADLNNLKDNQEKHKPEDLEHHKPEDLKPADYDTIKNELNKWKNTFGGRSPEDIKKIVDSQDSQAAGTSSGTAGTTLLTTEQQERLSQWFIMAAFLRKTKGDDAWKKFVENWGKDNNDYVERFKQTLMKQLFTNIEQKPKK